MIRIRKVKGGFIAEQKVVKWTLFGLSIKWVPYVETSGIPEAWVHSSFDFALMNVKTQVEQDIKELYLK